MGRVNECLVVWERKGQSSKKKSKETIEEKEWIEDVQLQKVSSNEEKSISRCPKGTRQCN